MRCRHCKTELTVDFADLGFAPHSNAYLTNAELSAPEKYFRLKVKVCHNCWLVQTDDESKSEDLFKPDYAYFSSTSKSWLEHARNYVERIITFLDLDKSSNVIEIASNDGYLLKYFNDSNIPCLGIEPTEATAKVSIEKGIETVIEFFGEDLANKLAASGRKADLIIGNNVFAHVPDINDFTAGLKILLKTEGTITLEFPHLLNLIKEKQFDTIYHEHFSYLSISFVNKLFNDYGLCIYKIEEISTHGGSVRVYVCHKGIGKEIDPSVENILNKENQNGLKDLTTYQNFQSEINKIKNDFLKFLIDCKEKDKSIAAYGAAAKGNTLINYAGVKRDLIPCIYDAAPSKQNKFLPGSHIPIFPPEALEEQHPDFLLIFPWNIANEIIDQLSFL